MARVLVVKDDPVVRKLIVPMLSSKGIETLEAADRYAGIELAIQSRPHVVLMDIMLPDLDGVTAIKRLRHEPETKGMRTVALTTGVTGAVSSETIPADTVLVKPFDLEALLAAVALGSPSVVIP